MKGRRNSSKEQLILSSGFVLWKMCLSITVSLTSNLSYPVLFYSPVTLCQQGYEAHSEEFSEKRRHSTEHSKLKLDSAPWQVESAFQTYAVGMITD